MDALSMAGTLAVKPAVGPAADGEASGPDKHSAGQTPAAPLPTAIPAAGAMVSSQPEQCSISDHSAATQISSHSEHSSPCNGPLAWPCVLPALPELDLRLPSSVPALARTELPTSPLAASPGPDTTPSPVASDLSAKDQRLTGPSAELTAALMVCDHDKCRRKRRSHMMHCFSPLASPANSLCVFLSSILLVKRKHLLQCCWRASCCGTSSTQVLCVALTLNRRD